MMHLTKGFDHKSKLCCLLHNLPLFYFTNIQTSSHKNASAHLGKSIKLFLLIFKMKLFRYLSSQPYTINCILSLAALKNIHKSQLPLQSSRVKWYNSNEPFAVIHNNKSSTKKKCSNNGLNFTPLP